MQQQRYNVFNQIHKGLRGMLYDTALRLQRTDFSGPEASQAIEPLHQVLLFFDDHADHEDRFILPHIRKHNAPLLDELEKEHEIDLLWKYYTDYYFPLKQLMLCLTNDPF